MTSRCDLDRQEKLISFVVVVWAEMSVDKSINFSITELFNNALNTRIRVFLPFFIKINQRSSLTKL